MTAKHLLFAAVVAASCQLLLIPESHAQGRRDFDRGRSTSGYTTRAYSRPPIPSSVFTNRAYTIRPYTPYSSYSPGYGSYRGYGGYRGYAVDRGYTGYRGYGYTRGYGYPGGYSPGRNYGNFGNYGFAPGGSLQLSFGNSGLRNYRGFAF
jgi:hypothetical protein